MLIEVFAPSKQRIVAEATEEEHLINIILLRCASEKSRSSRVVNDKSFEILIFCFVIIDQTSYRCFKYNNYYNLLSIYSYRRKLQSILLSSFPLMNKSAKYVHLRRTFSIFTASLLKYQSYPKARTDFL